MLFSEETYVQLPTSYVVKKFGKGAPKTVYLTFDDGPDPKYTPEVIDILKKEHVPAAFFMLGQAIESNIPLVRQMYSDGYEIGNHTFTHPNIAKISLARAKLEMNGTRRLIEIVTGHSTVMFRPPYNADAEPQDLAEIIPVEESRRENYITIGESIDPQDWDVEHINVDSIFNRVVAQQNLGSVILLHDAGGNRDYTVEALPRIIHYFKQKGYHFGTIAELLGRKEEDLMPAVTNLQERQFNQANFMVAGAFFVLQWFIYGLFFVGIFLSIGRVIFMGLLASVQKRRSVMNLDKSHVTPRVSIIIPAYNESVTAVKTIDNLLQSDYPDFEVIFVNDGSKDDTYMDVRNAFKDNPKVKIFDKPNGGKASALNLGIAHASADFVVCIDADTQLKHDAISRLMDSFVNEDIGAVACNVKVGNEVNFLTTWQSIEYTTSQNFDRRAFELLNCITVVPGAIGAFRKQAIKDAGGFTSDTLAEDCDLTIRILRAGYKVTTNNAAISMTEVPEKMDMFLRQRFRWCFGVMQTFWKHRDACFNSEYKALGWVALPNILVFQIVLPLFAPLADLLMILALVVGSSSDISKIGEYYLIFQLVDLAGAILAFSFEKENLGKLWMLIPQRFTYRWLMYYILFKSFSKALKGELQSWGVLKRSGNVRVAG
jgi:cellulose synthase/poly-beta-1,6-N-acetylglucosamine synthase-like glycosyltransferase/peptidoglycan/xylan/chitin deacetylase (PgdA/CDA1 family)